MDAGAVAPPLVEGGRGSGSALKRVPLALTAATASGEDAAGAGAIRFPLHYGATVTRWRLHVRNYNYASGTPLTSGGTVTGVWLGKGWAGAFTAAPTKVADGLTIPTDGSEVVTPWISAPLDAGVQQMLSVGWTASTSSPKVRTAGGAWVSASSGTASAQSGAGFSVSSWVPFDWWIEAETAPTTPTIAGYGDSITAGTGTSLILNDSWLSQYARSIGALPVHWAYPGSGMVLWTNPADQKWTRWADFPLADAVIHVMGQNDLGTATTAAIMRERFETTLPMIRAHISPVVAVSTVTPHANKTEAQNAVRREHAAWLKTLPHGVIDVFDFAAAVSTDDTVLRPEYRGGNGTDELHPNTAGAAALAAAITRPVVATPARDALTAYAAEIGD
jgi:lysophospholipase L1-like esterase